jgi:predicted N-acyltransferase
MMKVHAQILPHIADIDEEAWDACLPSEAENHAYYVACEMAGPVGHKMMALVAKDSSGIIAVAPLFEMAYRLDTPFQGALKPIGQILGRLFPSLVTLSVIGLGSPYAERCHIGFQSNMDITKKRETASAMMDALEAYALAHNISLLAIKDISPNDEKDLAPVLAQHKLVSIGSLPIALLNLKWKDEEDYISRLSTAMRKDLRRKLRRAKEVRIEERTDIADIADQIEALYASTREESGVDYGDFEMLPPGYFLAISKALKERALFMLFWIGDTLAGFNLLLIEETRVIDKFIGMRYPLAREHNLYFVRWMANIHYCLRHGKKILQPGQTGYELKVRLGCDLQPSAVYFRHRSKFVNPLLKVIAPAVAFDKLDPGLRALKRRKS